MKLTLVAACLVLLVLVQGSSANFLSDEFIDLLNKKAKTWTARRNFPKDTPISDLKKRLGALPEPSENYLPVVQHDIPENYEFPETFNAIDEWPNCTSLEEIRDQGSCGSCWAISSAEVMTDRHCIHSDARENFHYSTQDLVSCCHYCGFGCDGGWPAKAFQYWVRNGVVSGGPYNSHKGCYPYEITNTLFPVPTPACKNSCQSGYSVTYEEDKQFSERYYRVSRSETSIMQELMKNGPVVAAFDVYEDFYDYSSGVYQHTHGDYLGGHAIKILGFGVELGAPYWLCANSWGASWGEKGFFKILRGSNECYIENSVDTGLPKYEE